MIEREKDVITVSFVKLAPLVRHFLLASAERRLAALRTNLATDEDADENAADDDEDDALVNIADPSAAAAGDSATLANEAKAYELNEDGEPNWAALLIDVEAKRAKAALKKSAKEATATAAGAAAARCPGCGKRAKGEAGAFRKSARSFATLVARFVGPLVAVFTFFAVLYVTSTQALDKAIELNMALVGSANRGACSREVFMNARRDLLIYGGRDFIGKRWSTVADTAACVEEHQELMALSARGTSHGDYFDEMAPGIESGTSRLLDGATNAAVYSAQFDDLCPWVLTRTRFPEDTTAATAEDCAKFFNGVNAGGILVAARYYLDRVLVLEDRRLRARLFDVPKAERAGAGILIPLAAYNYTPDFAHAMKKGLPGDYLAPPPYPSAAFAGDGNETELRKLAAELPGALNYSFAAEWAQGVIPQLEQLDALYLTPALFRFVGLYSNAAQGTLSTCIFFLNTFLGCFVSLLVLFTGAAFLPQVTSTNREIMQKRNLLLQLPLEVVHGVPQLKRFVEDILAAESSGSAGADAGARRKRARVAPV